MKIEKRTAKRTNFHKKNERWTETERESARQVNTNNVIDSGRINHKPNKHWKFCSTCDDPSSLPEFALNSSNIDGYDSICNVCKSNARFNYEHGVPGTYCFDDGIIRVVY